MIGRIIHGGMRVPQPNYKHGGSEPPRSKLRGITSKRFMVIRPSCTLSIRNTLHRTHERGQVGKIEEKKY